MAGVTAACRNPESKSRLCVACGWGVFVGWDEVRSVLGDLVTTRAEILEFLSDLDGELDVGELDIFEIKTEAMAKCEFLFIVDEGCAIMFGDEVGENHAIETTPRKEILRVATLLGCKAGLQAVTVLLDGKAKKA